MAQSGVQGLVALAVSGVIGIYIVLQFTPLMVNAGAVIVVLTGLFGILIAYAVIRVFLWGITLIGWIANLDLVCFIVEKWYFKHLIFIYSLRQYKVFYIS